MKQIIKLRRFKLAELKDRLKELRQEKRLIQDELAKKLNISRNTITRYENGTRQPNINTVKKIAELFDVSTDYLLGISDRRYNFENVSLIELSDEYFKKIRETPKFYLGGLGGTEWKVSE